MHGKLILLIAFLVINIACTSETDKSNEPAQLLSRLFARNLLYTGNSGESTSSGQSIIDQDLPSNIAVAVPRSIRKTPPSTGFSIRNSTGQKNFQSLLSEGGTGVGILQDATTIISVILQDSKRDLLLITSVYPRAKASPGVCIPGGASNILVSDAMIQEILDGLKRNGLTDEEAITDLSRLQNLGVVPKLGESVPSPAIVYKKSVDKNYDHEVYYSFSETIATPKTCPSNIDSNDAFEKNLKWKDNKSQIFNSIRKTIRFLTVSVDLDASITYFTEAGKKDRAVLLTKQTTKLSSSSSNEITKRFTVEECTTDTEANTNNCISLSYRARDRKSSDLTIQTDVIGKTDNDGGQINTKIVQSGTGASGPKIEIDEYYNAEGVVNWIEYYEDDVLTDGFGTLDGTVYSFDANSLFEGFVDLTIDFGCVGSCVAEAAPDDYSTEDFFVLAFEGEDPNQDIEFIWGYGYYFDDNSSGDYDDMVEIFIEYWGEEADVPNLRIWRWLTDANGNDSYVLLDDTVSVN